MRTQRRSWIFMIGLIVLTMGCALGTATSTPTPTATSPSTFAVTLQASGSNPTPTMLPELQTVTAQVAAVETLASALATTLTPGGPVNGSIGGTGGSNGGTGGSNGGTGGNNGGTGGSNGGEQDSSEVTPTQPITLPSGGPYVVKQIETLGGEVISGTVCSLTQPFSVLSATPHVTFTFNFVPQDVQRGKVTYTYDISSAGEAHDAAGTYTLSPVGTDGTLQLSLTVSDHVVFKGFDGNILNRYKLNLVPNGTTSCPTAP